MTPGKQYAYRITLSGIVQGVGFRPFVYQSATELGLCGWVENCGGVVNIHAQGEQRALDAFVGRLRTDFPEQAVVTGYSITGCPLEKYTHFFIKESNTARQTASFLAADIAVCAHCMEEMRTEGNRRYGYPFLSCTNCGPRYSIVRQLPFDRENTAMSDFPLCEHCAEEYQSPVDRRFHAQTNCCPACGPTLRLLDNEGKSIAAADIPSAARELLETGKILAIKGIGGYHLCCDAQNTKAIERLRLRKHREHKPFAVMAGSLAAASALCELSPVEEQLLTGSKKPILLFRQKIPRILPESIAPRQKRLGLMLPYAPLQLLLFSERLPYLIMTSANIAGEPLCYREEQLAALSEVYDACLTHDRAIFTSVDDAVVSVTDDEPRLLRCGRGYAPLTLPLQSKQSILALGGEQKNTICITNNGNAILSQHLGDLKNGSNYDCFVQQARHLQALLGISPTVYAHDANEDYLSSRYARAQRGQTIAIQHHHAHMAGCMAEHGLAGSAIGVIFDGTGLGTDGTHWGGEFLAGTKAKVRRVGQLQPVTLQGGDNAVRQPWRCAASYLSALGLPPRQYLPKVSKEALDAVGLAIKCGIQCVSSSSMGRLFDCAAALCGLADEVTYDAQAAIEFEQLLQEDVTDCYRFSINVQQGYVTLGYNQLLTDLLEDVKRNENPSVVSAKFHNTIACATAECVQKIAAFTKLDTVILSGGIFDNDRLRVSVTKLLRAHGFSVYCNQRTPGNDGGLSYGQAAAAAALLEETGYVSCDFGDGD